MKIFVILIQALMFIVGTHITSCKKDTPLQQNQQPPVTNKSPIANAGRDTTLILPANNTMLDGSTSADPDGNIKSFHWEKISGPGSFIITDAIAAKTQVTSLTAGAYIFELTVTDNEGAIAMDHVNIFVISGCYNRTVLNARLVPAGNLSSARINLQCASAGNKILFIGGMHAGQNWWNEPVPVDIYNISTDTWSFHSLVPENPNFTHFRFGAAIATIGNKILFGGGGDGFGDNQSSQVDIYDASSGSWSSARLSAAREGLAAATVGDKVVFAGGFGYPDGWNWGEFNTVDIYDNSTNTWTTAALSEARSDLSETAAGNKIYFAGGRNGLYVSKTIDIYDAVTNTWSVSALQQPRVNMASIAAADKIFWAGGGNNFTGTGWSTNNNAEILDVNTGVLSIECIIPRSSFSAVIKNDNIVFFTGYLDEGNQFEIYNTTSGTWTTGILDHRVQGAAIISVNNTIYVAGGKVNGVFSSQVWKLEF